MPSTLPNPNKKLLQIPTTRKKKTIGKPATTNSAAKVDWNDVEWFVYEWQAGPRIERRVMARELSPGEMRPGEHLLGRVTGVSAIALRRLLNCHATLAEAVGRIAKNAQQQYLREQRDTMTPAFAARLKADQEYRAARRLERHEKRDTEFKRQLANAQA